MTAIKAVPMPPRYRVVVIEEFGSQLDPAPYMHRVGGHRIVATGPVIPEAAISRVATFLKAALPLLRTAAAVRPTVTAIGDLYAALTREPKAAHPRRRSRR